MNSPVVQHAANAAPAVATVTSVVAHVPEAISVLVGLAALFYYYLVIGNILADRKAKRQAKE